MNKQYENQPIIRPHILNPIINILVSGAAGKPEHNITPQCDIQTVRSQDDMSFEWLVFGAVLVVCIDQWISDGFSVILLGGFAHAELQLTQATSDCMKYTCTYLCNLGWSPQCERASLVSSSTADVHWFLFLNSEGKEINDRDLYINMSFPVDFEQLSTDFVYQVINIFM